MISCGCGDANCPFLYVQGIFYAIRNFGVIEFSPSFISIGRASRLVIWVQLYTLTVIVEVKWKEESRSHSRNEVCFRIRVSEVNTSIVGGPGPQL